MKTILITGINKGLGKELLELGAITQEEFDEKKSVLLKDI